MHTSGRLSRHSTLHSADHSAHHSASITTGGGTRLWRQLIGNSASRLLALLLALVLTATPPHAQTAGVATQMPSASALQSIRAYIHDAWPRLTRSNADIATAAQDPKVPHTPGRRWPVYVAATEDVERVRRELRSALSARDWASVDVRNLPALPSTRWRSLPSTQDEPAYALAGFEHGLLYLPRPYVVPGGRFNEMYGWDSYFIETGLLEDGEVQRAQDVVDDFIYEVRRFGKVLNANRTYYLTRSQPPFLTRMVLALFDRTHDRQWLRGVRPELERYYRFWVTGPHAWQGDAEKERLSASSCGLSRYWDFGEGPAPEVVYGERDAQGRTHYDRVREFYRTHTVTDYDITRYYDRAHDQLTPLFYKGDRSMRESGFDPSNRFGPFGVDVINFAPVCLNTLLFVMENDLAEIARILDDTKGEASWRERARIRRTNIDRYLWDEQAGLYFDYNVETGQRRRYEFATTFYPLWAGAASPAQAARVRANLSRFEAPGGLLTSTTTSGSQWDAPFGWAPLQMIAADGLRRYGYTADADRLAAKFVSLVVANFQRSGTIVEKYDVVTGQSQVGSELTFGYKSNEIGFGWTNAAVLHLSVQH